MYRSYLVAVAHRIVVDSQGPEMAKPLVPEMAKPLVRVSAGEGELHSSPENEDRLARSEPASSLLQAITARGEAAAGARAEHALEKSLQGKGGDSNAEPAPTYRSDEDALSPGLRFRWGRAPQKRDGRYGVWLARYHLGGGTVGRVAGGAISEYHLGLAIGRDEFNFGQGGVYVTDTSGGENHGMYPGTNFIGGGHKWTGEEWELTTLTEQQAITAQKVLLQLTVGPTQDGQRFGEHDYDPVSHNCRNYVAAALRRMKAFNYLTEEEFKQAERIILRSGGVLTQIGAPLLNPRVAANVATNPMQAVSSFMTMMGL